MNKAYRVTSYEIDVYDSEYYNLTVYAENANQAKSIGWKKGNFRDYYKELKYTDLVAIREESLDKQLIDGQWLTPIEKWVYERNKFVKNSDSSKLYLIKKGDLYWGENHCGYTTKYYKAGIYTHEEASKVVLKSEYDRQETIVEYYYDKSFSIYFEDLKELERRINCLKQEQDEITEIHLRQREISLQKS